MKEEWPALTTYEGKFLRRVAMPLGGIGTGTVSLGGRGDLRDWAIMNTPAVGYTPKMLQGMRHTAPFFCLNIQSESKNDCRVLEGPIDPELYEASEGSHAPNHGLPRFRDCRFHSAYPFANVELKDPSLPVTVNLKAFNPLIPGDSENSGLPLASLCYEVKNIGDQLVDASIAGTLINIVGADGRVRKPYGFGDSVFTGTAGNRNRFLRENGKAGIFMDSRKVPRKHSAWGSIALTIPDSSESDISYRTSWSEKTWGDSTLDFWNDFSDDGMLEEREAPFPYNLMGSLAVKKTIPPGETVAFPFVLSWYFPNRKSWNIKEIRIGSRMVPLGPGTIGNYYTSKYSNAWDAALKETPGLAALEEKSLTFVRTFCNSDLPDEIKEAALFNLSTLRTQTCFRTPDGKFFGWEGIHDDIGSCFGSCTHVWNYEQSTPFLFGDLAVSMRETEFFNAMKKNGLIKFRTFLPLKLNHFRSMNAAADGQMGCVMKVYREWQLSGDRDFLKKIWPKVKKALEFCWLPGGWDSDTDGIMEGCQHNTMDVEYYGPNPQMELWYLGALKAAGKMARYLEDYEFAGTCDKLFKRGKEFTDKTLFNGEFYEHIIEVPKNIRRGLASDMGAKDLSDPILQLGSGCLIDQLVGQYMAHIMDLGYLVNKEHITRTLDSILRYNSRDEFYTHFNHLRSYVFNDEKAVLMASYPRNNQPHEPFPYANEVMTGFEHALAGHLIYEGKEEEALEVIRNIRDRYDGYKRNPFDEAECGHHYIRAMAAWSSVLAWSGFHYSAVDRTMVIAAREGTFFWSNGYAWGDYLIKKDPEAEVSGKKWIATFRCLHGRIKLHQIIIKGVGAMEPSGITLNEGENQAFSSRI